MELSTVLSGLAVLAAIVFPLLARRDLITRLHERDERREEWRAQLNERMRLLETAPWRIEQLERWHYEYKDWKHEKVDPYLNDYTALERRVSRIENVLNGKLK